MKFAALHAAAGEKRYKTPDDTHRRRSSGVKSGPPLDLPPVPGKIFIY